MLHFTFSLLPALPPAPRVEVASSSSLASTVPARPLSRCALGCFGGPPPCLYNAAGGGTAAPLRCSPAPHRAPPAPLRAPPGCCLPSPARAACCCCPCCGTAWPPPAGGHSHVTQSCESTRVPIGSPLSADMMFPFFRTLNTICRRAGGGAGQRRGSGAGRPAALVRLSATSTHSRRESAERVRWRGWAGGETTAAAHHGNAVLLAERHRRCVHHPELLRLRGCRRTQTSLNTCAGDDERRSRAGGGGADVRCCAPGGPPRPGRSGARGASPPGSSSGRSRTPRQPVRPFERPR